MNSALFSAKGHGTVKTTKLIPFLFVGALLQGCMVDSTPIDDGASSDGMDINGAIQDDAPRSAASASELEVDAKIATVNVPGGQIIFVDEGMTEPGGGIAFWEMGGADLSHLLDDENATALEVFLAITPEGTPVPERLLEHHAEVMKRVPGITAEPRRLAVPFVMPKYVGLTNESLNDGNSFNDEDCWAWAGTSTPYHTNYGYQSFDLTSFQSNFNSQYSQISGALVSSGVDSDLSQSLTTGFLGPTAAGHERAMAFCLSKAQYLDISLERDCSSNRGSAKVFVKRTTDANYSLWVTADIITLTDFGQGGRFRSNYTNSGGARKYALEVEWPTIGNEPSWINSVCKDELVLAWRSKWAPPLSP